VVYKRIYPQWVRAVRHNPTEAVCVIKRGETMKELTLCTVGIELIGSALQKPRGKKIAKSKI
jgi:hypothetical protein